MCTLKKFFLQKQAVTFRFHTLWKMYKIWKYFEKRQVIDCVRLLHAINCWRRPCLCMYIQKWKNNSTLKWVNQLFIFWSSEFRPPNYYSIIKYVLDMGLTYHLSFDILLTFLVWWLTFMEIYVSHKPFFVCLEKGINGRLKYKISRMFQWK